MTSPVNLTKLISQQGPHNLGGILHCRSSWYATPSLPPSLPPFNGHFPGGSDAQ